MIHWISTGLSTLVALYALGIAMRTRAAQRKRLPRSITLRLAELEAELDKHTEWWRKLNANVASLRARQKPQEASAPEGDPNGTAMLPGESPASWKRRIRLLQQRGAI